MAKHFNDSQTPLGVGVPRRACPGQVATPQKPPGREGRWPGAGLCLRPTLARGLMFCKDEGPPGERRVKGQGSRGQNKRGEAAPSLPIASAKHLATARQKEDAHESRFLHSHLARQACVRRESTSRECARLTFMSHLLITPRPPPMPRMARDRREAAVSSSRKLSADGGEGCAVS